MTNRVTRRVGWLAVVAAVAVVVVLLGPCGRRSTPATVLVAAAGDLACSSADPGTAQAETVGGQCRAAAVAAQVAKAKPSVFLGLGDYQYEEARAADYQHVYGPAWGRFKAITIPALGNQEYKVHAANTFFAYFGDRAGPRPGWSSHTVGRWHVIVLNSSCLQIGGCGPGSPEARWLAQDLAHDHARCTLAIWHHPRFSTGLHGSDRRTVELWRLLQAHGADLVLSAHEHDYERFGPLRADTSQGPDGIRSFVVGTGGQDHYAPAETTGLEGQRRTQAGSQVRIDDTAGALLLTLAPTSYSWRFVDETGRVRDAGTQPCRVPASMSTQP